MRIAIVEDRPEDQQRLSALLAEDSGRRGWRCAVEAYPSGAAFLAAETPFDIVFLDIMMDGIDGLETARRFRAGGGRALLVFVTVEADYAVEGYEVEAAAFLVKPARPEMFRRVMDRLARRLEKDAVVALPGGGISAGEVLYATVDDHYLKVFTAGQRYSPNLSLEEFRSRLPDDGRFLECRRGVLVNLDHVARVDAKAVEMDDGARLPVGRRRRQAVAEAVAARKFSRIRRDMA